MAAGAAQARGDSRFSAQSHDHTAWQVPNCRAAKEGVFCFVPLVSNTIGSQADSNSICIHSATRSPVVTLVEPPPTA